MKRMALCTVLIGLVCCLTALPVCAAETDERTADKEQEVLRVIENLEKAGLKVTDDEGAKSLEADEIAFRSLLAKLEGPSISVEYKDTPLQEVLDNLQQITGVNLLLDPKVDEAERRFGDTDLYEPPQRKVTLTLKDVKPISVIKHILRMQNLMAVYADEALMVTVPTPEPPITLTYDVVELTELRDFSALTRRTIHGLGTDYRRRLRPLVIWEENDDQDAYLLRHDDYYRGSLMIGARPEPKPRMTGEELIDKLKEATPQGNWDEECYSMTYANGVLVVTQRPEVQVQVVNILMMLKARR